MKAKQKSPRARLLSALFKKAAQHDISHEHLREEIALSVIGKRLSEATLPEIGRVIDHITGRGLSRVPVSRYASSLSGLKEEVADLAKDLWGEGWELSLIRFCNRFGVSHYRFLNISHGKEIKKRLIEMNCKDKRLTDN